MTTPRGYAAARPHAVPESLNELTGPAAGDIVLPVRLDWGPPRTYHLEDRADARLLYERVIREALHVDDLRNFLSQRLLIELWPQLFLPLPVRQLWEARFALPTTSLAA